MNEQNKPNASNDRREEKPGLFGFGRAQKRPANMNLYIIAGCNGAGKTTASFTVLPEMLKCREFVNADEIAAGLSPFNPEGVAIQAGRLMIDRIIQRRRGHARRHHRETTQQPEQTQKNTVRDLGHGDHQRTVRIKNAVEHGNTSRNFCIHCTTAFFQCHGKMKKSFLSFCIAIIYGKVYYIV